MVDITEGRLQFQFGEGVNAIKFDATQWHRQRMGSSLKAMDILVTSTAVGVADAEQRMYWWMEIKDCLDDEERSRTRMAPTELPEVTITREWVEQQGWKPTVSVRRRKLYIVDELIEKLRDTLASMSIAAHEANLELAAFVVAPRQKLTVILVICWLQNDFKRLAKALHTKLERALAPYGLQGFIVDEHVAVPGLIYEITRVEKTASTDPI